MEKYQTLCVVDDESLLHEKHQSWNRTLGNYLEAWGDCEIIVPRSQVRFNEDTCHFQILKKHVTLVSDTEFLYPKSHQINLTFGSQFGFQAGGLKAPADLGFLRVAVLSKSRLSGHISGVRFAYVDEDGNYRDNKDKKNLRRPSNNGQKEQGKTSQSEIEASNKTPSLSSEVTGRIRTPLTKNVLVKVLYVSLVFLLLYGVLPRVYLLFLDLFEPLLKLIGNGLEVFIDTESLIGQVLYALLFYLVFFALIFALPIFIFIRLSLVVIDMWKRFIRANKK